MSILPPVMTNIAHCNDAYDRTFRIQGQSTCQCRRACTLGDYMVKLKQDSHGIGNSLQGRHDRTFQQSSSQGPEIKLGLFSTVTAWPASSAAVKGVDISLSATMTCVSGFIA